MIPGSEPGVIVLRPDDAARMAFLHKAAFGEVQAWREAAMAELLQLSSVLALGVEGEIGLCALVLIQRAASDAEILTLGVAPTARRQGLASGLIRAAAAMLGQRGTARLLLDVAADNTGAITFYAQLGFGEDGRRKAYYRREDGPRVDAVLMSRSVAGQA